MKYYIVLQKCEDVLEDEGNCFLLESYPQMSEITFYFFNARHGPLLYVQIIGYICDACW